MNRRLRIYSLVATAIAVPAGLVTLVAYFVPVPALQALQLWLLSLVSLLAAWALLAGALNLIIVHTRKFLGQAPGWLYSLVVVIGFFIVVLANLLAPLIGWGRGAANVANLWIFNYLLSAGGAALAGLIAFSLVLAGYRMLRQSRNASPSIMAICFVVSLVVALVALSPWPVGVPNPSIGGTHLRDILRAMSQVPAMAGSRGLLLGIALGASATGLRLLLGLDRPYGE